MFFFFLNDTATPEIYTLSLHDSLPICQGGHHPIRRGVSDPPHDLRVTGQSADRPPKPVAMPEWAPATVRTSRCGMLARRWPRSEEHTSELQSRQYLVCRLLLEKKNKTA